jgi:hypothetical protein
VVLGHLCRNGSYCPVPLGAFGAPGPFDLQEEVGSFVDEATDPREQESNNPPVSLLFGTYHSCPSSLSNHVGCWSSKYLMSALMATCRLIIVVWYVVHTIADQNALTAILTKTRRHK